MMSELKVLLLGVLVLVCLALYSFAGFTISGWGGKVRKADFLALYERDMPSAVPFEINAGNNDDTERVFSPDTAKNILFFGDSMLEGLSRRFIDYADQNGHELNTVIWYSSTSETWAQSDTLQYFLKKFNPDYAVICLGSNELFVKDAKERKKYISKIIDKLGGLPYVWISPPNWKEDTGINDAIISIVGRERYFDSRNLELKRGKDHAHPTFKAAEVWMDTVANWMQSRDCINPIVMEWPEVDVPARNLTLLSSSKK